MDGRGKVEEVEKEVPLQLSRTANPCGVLQCAIKTV